MHKEVTTYVAAAWAGLGLYLAPQVYSAFGQADNVIAMGLGDPFLVWAGLIFG